MLIDKPEKANELLNAQVAGLTSFSRSSAIGVRGGEGGGGVAREAAFPPPPRNIAGKMLGIRATSLEKNRK